MKLFGFDLSGIKSFVVPTLILVTIILIIPFAFIPLLNNAQKTNDSLKKQQDRLARLSEKLEVLNALDEKDINDKLTLAEQALPVGKSLAQLVVGIRSLAISSDLLLEGISLSPGKVGTESAAKESESSDLSSEGASQGRHEKKRDTLVLQVSLRGTISAVENFLSKIQHAKRLSFANDVSLESSEQKKFTVEIQLLTPFRPVPRLTGDALAEPLPLLSAKNEETLSLIEEFDSYTNIQINEVKTNVVKDPFKGR